MVRHYIYINPVKQALITSPFHREGLTWVTHKGCIVSKWKTQNLNIGFSDSQVYDPLLSPLFQVSRLIEHLFINKTHISLSCPDGLNGFKLSWFLSGPNGGAFIKESSRHTKPALLKIEFYWTRTTAIHLHILSSCFCATPLQLKSCDRDDMANSATGIYSLVLYRKKLAKPQRGAQSHVLFLRWNSLYWVEWCYSLT